MQVEHLKEFLEAKYHKYSELWFIDTDPISIPHKFSKIQDIEISSFLSAVIAWGQRKTIINNATKLMELMENDPHNFILHSSKKDLHRFEGFVHRTFNGTDCMWFIEKLKSIYGKHQSLEDYYLENTTLDTYSAQHQISDFKARFMHGAPARTKKHLASPAVGSTAKRINMWLRWMVRKDAYGIDFGIWNKLSPSKLYLPLDVHTARVGRALGLINSTQDNWKTVEELTENCRKLCPLDPVKYDLALFGIGAFESDFTLP
ncbi:MAG: TIGR02757 family protein [Luteibaculaceae bacterium]